jgi:hypothetical protein
VLRVLWPTVQACESVVIRSADMAIQPTTRVRELKGKRFR